MSKSNRTLLATQWLAFLSSVMIIVGVAPSQVLLGCAIVALLVSREKLTLPPIKLPLALFLLGTAIAIVLSGDPVAAWPQIKKVFVLGQLLVVFAVLREINIARYLVLTWAALGGLSAAVGFWQFAVKLNQIRESGVDLYTGYVGERITGFMSHWYTYSVEQMIVLIMLGSFLLFSPSARKRAWIWVVLAFMIGISIILAQTRAVWIATAIACTYLVVCWRPKLTLAIPVVMVAGFFLAPPMIRERVVSIVRPSEEDSNLFRVILMRTGLRMVEAHPWFGLGPERPRELFMDYLPPDVSLPLPDGSYMHLHNIYLQYAAERGIPVMLVFLWLMGKIMWDFLRHVRKLPPGPDDRRFLLHGGVAVVIALLVEGMADVNLGDSEVLAMFLVVIALGYNAIRTRTPALSDQVEFPAGETARPAAQSTT